MKALIAALNRIATALEQLVPAVQQATRKIRKRWDRARAPWPIVAECHSGFTARHRCEQCHPLHDHQWRAWNKAPRWVTAGPGVPVRCRICGGRKCDYEECQLARHSHTHDRTLL